MLTADPPVLVNVSDRFTLLPTCTLPNERLVGLAESVPPVTPVPESAILRLGFAPSESIAKVPDTALPAVGANRTVNDVLWPAVRVNGNVSPLMLNPLPVAEAADMVRLVPPELVRFSVRLCELPTVTFPKLKLVGFGVI